MPLFPSTSRRLTTSEGFVVVELTADAEPTMRFWILHSDVDARVFANQMTSRLIQYEYVIRRANVAEFEYPAD